MNGVLPYCRSWPNVRFTATREAWHIRSFNRKPEEATEIKARKHVGHVSNVPGLTTPNHPTCE